MKKTFKCVVMATLMLLLLVGCGDKYADSEYVGTWRAKTAEMSDITVNVEDVYGEMTLELAANGTATITTKEDKASDPWTPNNKGVTISSEGEDLVFKQVKGNVLAGDFGGVKISFEKVDEDD